MKKTAEVIGLIIIGLATIFLVSVILAVPTMLLWNWLCTDIFKFRSIDFWQAMGLNILSGILFRSGSATKKD